jgi:hypothetical protein
VDTKVSKQVVMVTACARVGANKPKAIATRLTHRIAIGVLCFTATFR